MDRLLAGTHSGKAVRRPLNSRTVTIGAVRLNDTNVDSMY